MKAAPSFPDAVTNVVTKSGGAAGPGEKLGTNFVGKPVTNGSTSYAHKIVGKVTKLQTEESRRGWIEYNPSGKRRYPRLRWWLRRNGKWVKNKKPPRVPGSVPLTEEQYLTIKEREERIKEAEYRDR